MFHYLKNVHKESLDKIVLNNTTFLLLDQTFFFKSTSNGNLHNICIGKIDRPNLPQL